MGVLSVLEVSKKQYYIFKTNRLKENIGASTIIEQVTETLPKNLCKNYGGHLINNGGGRSIYFFDTLEDAVNFNKELTKRMLLDYPGLEFFVGTETYNPNEDIIIDQIDALFAKVERKKASRKHYASISDFGVTEKCSSTRLPAVEVTQKGRKISAEVRAKIDAANRAYKNNAMDFYATSSEELGLTANEKAYIAITHIDGNRMGKRIEELKKAYKKKYTLDNRKSLNEDYLKDLSAFSETIKKAFDQAFEEVVKTLQSNKENLKKANMRIKEDVIPIRKIILAGDDVCFLTDARIALECSRIFIQALEKHTLMGEKITACSGVAMVKDKFPFFKTYKLAESLCDHAKLSIPENALESRIDWQIMQGDFSESLSEIRDKAYKAQDGKYLSLRPLLLSIDQDESYHYKHFLEDMKRMNTKNIARGKIKGMLPYLKQGESATDIYIGINALHPLIGAHRSKASSGFLDGKCVIFDAIESMDLFLPLEGGDI